ncbi:RsmE family RNA methyltransferase [Aridibaculum aurantiacum]|uniref:RsmE family RNA methyltransferase n=1 Tax=Aridibaculum aurantiacum TaxID=2810307 RepID=UPI001A95F7EE|nr:RsmE family RNA methyltransferase [Aridibaculum aurantiacum]
MSLPIFFHDEAINGEFMTLNEDASKHIVQVLRMKEGEALHLTDGRGNLFTTVVADAHKKRCSVRISESSYKPQKDKQVSIAISLLKNASRFEWFLEKATEIGVTSIIPLLCHRTEKQHFRYERMKQIVVSAMMQSQQVWLPVLHQPVAFKEAIESSDFSEKLVAHCEDEQKHHVRDFHAASSVQILIGPEGDFTKEEIALALEHNYKPVTLGDTRLRAETAGVVAASLLCV